MKGMLLNHNTAFYRTRGCGENKILCLHGAGCNSLHWMTIDPPEGWQIIAVDLSGHGLSQEEPFDHIDEYAQWVSAFIENLGARVLLAGHSMGGAIALSVAYLQPEKLLGLVLTCTGATLGVSEHVLDLCRGEDTTEINRFLAKYAYSRDITQQQIQLWQKELGTPPSAVYLADFTACSGFDFSEKLTGIQLPALVVCATEDRMTPPAYADFLSTQLPCAELVEVRGSGHMVMLEQPEHFSRVLGEFCYRISVHTESRQV